MPVHSMPKAKDLINNLKSGQSIFIQGGASTPKALIDLLMEHAHRLVDIKIYHLHTEGEPTYAFPQYRNSFIVKNLFVGRNMRALIDFDRIDYIPCFLSEMPSLFKTKKIKIDMAFIQTTYPDKNGLVSLGTSVDTVKAALKSADLVLAEVNEQMPKVFGDGIINLNQIHAVIESNRPLYASTDKSFSAEEEKIGQTVATLIENGSCLQLGIGAIPSSVLTYLSGHKDLGLHSEMCSDGVVDLLKSGAINNSQKRQHQGKSVCTFILGTKKLYDFVNDNPNFYLLEADYVNNPTIIARNSKMVSINSAIEVDLTGQVCADSIGTKIISGVGGQIDFIRGSSLSDGGKSIIAMTSRSKKGTSRIVSQLHDGAGVVTSRAHVHYVVTEYGIADLYGKSLGERARLLIEISHPDDRDLLSKQWREITKRIT
jgi:4-hydroxybutyrate CoA-transferase